MARGVHFKRSELKRGLRQRVEKAETDAGSLADYRRAFRRGSKYGNKRSESSLFTKLAGRSFQSTIERKRAELLCIREDAGEISGLRFQPEYFLTDAEIGYHADFEYQENGRTIVEEVKGFRTERWKLIRRLWRVYGPHLMKVVTRNRRGQWREQSIMPKELTNE